MIKETKHIIWICNTFNDTHNQVGIAHNGGLVPLLKLLDSKNGSLQHNAAFALYNLADNEGRWSSEAARWRIYHSRSTIYQGSCSSRRWIFLAIPLWWSSRELINSWMWFKSTMMMNHV
ncbi:uncharacterized protein LOC106770947 [Vigna radiata var. radiata]|uniref:Uncharacterized protein LOC106770947 n=1 Tax=Vigna radiata var. radiata TaxID=3916 RepID=A0A3Q0EM62_VIGRR|nr:uncharacterized protein LOC106770947 [Vigna radiata var. radiata]